MTVLALNGGSSSLKFALFREADSLVRLLRGSVERIGESGATLRAIRAEGVALAEQHIDATTPIEAGECLMDWLRAQLPPETVTAIGHRIVHGGIRSPKHQRITPELLAELEQAVPLDPTHLPTEIALLRVCEQRFAGVPQVACFDTAFHRDLPRIATLLPISRRYDRAGVRRYGFHGLSFEYLMAELERIGKPGEAGGRVVLAHLGSGASMAAVRDRKPIDTTMAFTPASGLMMGTRPGDLDPGVLVYLARSAGWDTTRMDQFVNAECGLLGVSECSSDLRDLMQLRASDTSAAEAIELFCRSARKSIGALAAVLGGIDTLVFSGGIGEHSPEARSEICQGLEFLGIRIDAKRNATNRDDDGTGIISADGDGGKVVVRVVRTDEELMIARHIGDVLGCPTGAGPARRRGRGDHNG